MNRTDISRGIQEIRWDHEPPRRVTDGVTIVWEHPAGRGVLWQHCVSAHGLVPQSLAAVLLGVSVMTVNKWVRARKLYHIKADGHPSQIPLYEVKRILQERSASGLEPKVAEANDDHPNLRVPSGDKST